MAKVPTGERRAARMQALAMAWPDMSARLRARLVPAATLEHWLRTCGAAWNPADLGISMTKLAVDYRRARLIRRRYTILDVLDDLGWLDEAIGALFAAGGFWDRRQD